MKIGEILIRRQLISSAQLKEVIEIQTASSQKLGELMMFKDWIWIEKKDLEAALKKQYWRKNGYWIID
ncbi:MAG: hypothetical protein F6K24_23305 [Okeania sp. SIO2D1]|uniref:hypothetical protein n=1 Tax=Okeania sp. SIO2C9 TaxID=2607791 RepID=UPI0013B80BD4|nr:hypothetical protein [Okeania sp. SIO2C9]NEQ75215.1 hypothetical protein [Okeania sp. SIO2C9]NES67962.1 hypothetical protein [Okeania sp. SIO2D1]